MNALPTQADHSYMRDKIFEALLTAFPFVPVALSVTTYRYLHLDYSVTSTIQLIALAIFLALIVVGWINGFPRWSYPYVTVIGAIALGIIIGHDSDMNFWENLGWKVGVLGPVVLLFGAFWLLLRKRHPLRRLIQNIRFDWTLFALCIYSLLVIVMLGIFTNIRSNYGAPYLYISTLLAITGAALYIFLADKTQRLAALAVCFSLVWGVMAFGSATFWDGRQEKWMEVPANGLRLAGGYALAWAIMLALMLLPIAVGWLRGIRTRV